MPEDYIIGFDPAQDKATKEEATIDTLMYQDLTLALKEKLKKLRREMQVKLLKEFVDYLNKHYYPINNDDVMKKQIETFLDERNK
jgi:rubrerythrin